MNNSYICEVVGDGIQQGDLVVSKEEIERLENIIKKFYDFVDSVANSTLFSMDKHYELHVKAVHLLAELNNE